MAGPYEDYCRGTTDAAQKTDIVRCIHHGTQEGEWRPAILLKVIFLRGCNGNTTRRELARADQI